ncbi:MAG: hypothetical protein AAGF84_15270 [Planctomycetota bacterium]
MSRCSKSPTRGRRGVAMIETVLTLPFIFVLLALIMYCGVTMLRWHRVSTIDRYELWRSVAAAPGPSAPSGGNANAFDASPLGRAFFPAGTSSGGQSQTAGGRYGLEQLTVAVRRGQETQGNQDPAFSYLSEAIAGNGTLSTVALFEDLFLNSARPLPGIRAVEVGGEFSDRFGQDFAGQFDHTVSRLDGDWRYVNDAIDMKGERFFDQLNDVIDVPLYHDDPDFERPRRIVSPAQGIWEYTFGNFRNVVSPLTATNPLADELRGLALRVPAYAGPKLPIAAERLPNLDWDFEWSPPEP